MVSIGPIRLLHLPLFIICYVLLNACGTTPPPEISPPMVDQETVIKVPVVKVIDGDTIVVVAKGREETVRLLLIDTPETHHPILGVQPFGKEASNETHHLLDHHLVTLELAVNQERDHYGRMLAYAFIGNTSVETTLLRKGLARVAYVIPPNIKYLDDYRLAEDHAKKAHQGIWRFPGYAREDGFHPEAIRSTRSY